VALHQQTVHRPLHAIGTGDWRRGLPVLRNSTVLLRGLRRSDAASLLEHLGVPEVQEFLAPAPPDLKGFERFVRWTRLERTRGRHICFGVIPAGQSVPVGILQLWPVQSDFHVAEWGFALGPRYWGTGVFEASARLLLDFAFDTIGTHRMEARAAVGNVRGNGALRKMGATPEAQLRKCLRRGGEYLDHVMWTILAEEWLGQRHAFRPLP
jgi:RimJ/RimL family protein N-acetyltransferase